MLVSKLYLSDYLRGTQDQILGQLADACLYIETGRVATGMKLVNQLREQLATAETQTAPWHKEWCSLVEVYAYLIVGKPDNALEQLMLVKGSSYSDIRGWLSIFEMQTRPVKKCEE
jgi:hypothetical protein